MKTVKRFFLALKLMSPPFARHKPDVIFLDWRTAWRVAGIILD